MSIIIYRPIDTVVEIHDGAPPADQSTEVRQLIADLAAMTADRDEWKRRYEGTLPPQFDPPRITGFVATPDTIDAGQSTTLTATLENVASARLNGEPVVVQADGAWSAVVSPDASRTYVLDVVGLDGSTLTSVMVPVTVRPVVEPPIA